MSTVTPSLQQVLKPRTPGVYKTQSNSFLTKDGTIHHYVDPLLVPAEMNLMLIKQRYTPATIPVELKGDYYDALEEADNGNLAPFTHCQLSYHHS